MVVEVVTKESTNIIEREEVIDGAMCWRILKLLLSREKYNVRRDRQKDRKN